MQEATCNRCGASVIFSAKFCRQCGNRLDESEMTTRTLEAPAGQPPPFDHPTRPANVAPTSPTYAPQPMMAPYYDQMPRPPAPPASNKTALFVILGLVLMLLIGAGVVGFLVFGRFSHRPLAPPPLPPPPPVTGVIPRTPPIPNPPRVTPPEPPVPGSVKTTLDASLRYPGAEVVVDVNSGDGVMTQLHTTDDIDKVTDWYVEKIRPKKHVNMPGGVLLDGDNAKVLLTSGGDDTSIQVIRKSRSHD